MNREKNSLIVIYAVSVAVFLTIFFAIPFNRIAASWVAFAFGVVSIIVGLCVSIYATKDGNNLKSKLYGFPMFRLGYYYTIAQVVVSLVIIVIASMFEMPTWIPVVVGIILLAIVVAGTVAVDNAREYIVRQESRDTGISNQIDNMKTLILSLIGKKCEAETQKELEKLLEEVRFSDPVSSEKTLVIEEQIIQRLNDLSTHMSERDVTKDISDIRDLLRNRNDICKQSK